MESISTSLSQFNLHHTNLIQSHLSSSSSSSSPAIKVPSVVSFPYRFPKLYIHRLKASSSGGGGQYDGGADLLRKPVAEMKEDDDDGNDYENEEEGGGNGKRRGEEGWIDWEDQILEDTVPLVGFVRMILHSGKYASGERLSPEHERTILERLLPHHPESKKKIGCGISYITVGYHPDFESSRCLFIVRTDGEMVDFSYWKCIKGLIRKNYPLYADSFILRHFRRRRHND